MSADLLRRTAARLRASVNSLGSSMTGSWFVRSGHVIADDGTDVGMLVVDPYQPADDGPLMEHIALVASPPAVLALADLLDLASRYHAHVGDTEVSVWDLSGVADNDPTVALARAILREES